MNFFSDKNKVISVWKDVALMKERNDSILGRLKWSMSIEDDWNNLNELITGLQN